MNYIIYSEIKYGSLTLVIIYTHIRTYVATMLTSWNMTIALNESSIILSFNQSVNVATCNPPALVLQSAPFHSSDASLILSNVPASSCTAPSISTLLVRLTGITQQRLLCNYNLATNSTNSFLSMGSNFVRDSINQPVDPVVNTEAQRVAQFTVMLPSPSIVQANRLVLNSGYLDFTLNVPVPLENIDVTHLTLVRGINSYTITSAAQSFTITNCFRVGLTLSSFDLDRILATLLPEGSGFTLRTSPGAFLGIDGQINRAQTGSSLMVLNDTTSPQVNYTSLDFSLRMLMIHFSEPVSIASFNGSRISIVNQLQSPSISYNLSTTIVNQPENHYSNILNIVITPELVSMIENQAFIGDTRHNTLLSLQDGFIQDIAGNPYSSGEEADNIIFDVFMSDHVMPQLTSAIMDLNNGYLHLTFDETIKLNTFNIYEIHFYSSLCNDSSNNYTLKSGVVYSQGITNIVDVQVSHDLDDIITLIPIGQSQTCLHLTEFTATDYANQPLRPVYLNISLIPDTDPPSVLTFYKYSDISLVLVFSETIDVQSFNTTFLLFVFTNTSSGNVYNISDPEVAVLDQNSNNILVTLSNEVLMEEYMVTNDTVCDIYNSNDIEIQLYVTGGLVYDLSGNSLVGSKGLISQCNNCTLMAPSLTGFDLDMNMGTLRLSFSHEVSLQWINGNVTITNSESNPSAVYTFMDIFLPTAIFKLVYIININQTDLFSLQSIPGPQLATTQSNTYIQVQPQIATDRAGLPLDNTGPIRVSNFIPDTTRPTLEAFDLDLDAGLMSLSFSEPIKLSTFNITSVGLVSMINGEPSYLVNATALSSGIQTVVDYFLDQNVLIDIKRRELCYTMMNCYSVILSNAVEDAVGNNVVQISTDTALAIRQLTFDVTPPYLIAFTQFDLDAGTFTLLFNEPVNSSSADVTDVQFGDAYLTPAHSISLTDAFTTADHIEITFILTATDLNKIKNNSYICTEGSNCWIKLPRFFISDIHTNPFYIPGSVASYHQPLVFVRDSTPPVLTSYLVDANCGELTLVFSEVIIVETVNPSDINILNTRSGIVELQLNETSAVRYNNLTSVAIHLTVADLNILKSIDNIFTSISNTFLSLASTTQLSDVNGNVISPVSGIQPSNFIPDTTPPQLTTFAQFNINNGTFVLYFNEPIDKNRIYLNRLTLQGLQNGGPSFTLTGGIINNVTMYNTVIEVLMFSTEREIVKVTSRLVDNAATTFIYYDENVFYDAAGNGIITLPSRTALHLLDDGYIGDSSKVLLSSYELDMNQGAIILTFDDAIDINSISYSDLMIQNQSTSTSDSYQLSDGIIRNNSLGGINSCIWLTLMDQNAIKGLLSLATSTDNTYITITSQFIRDYEGRDIIPIPATTALQATSYYNDVIVPELEAFASLDMNLGTLVLIFSETILVNDTMVTSISLQCRQNSFMYSYNLQDSVITTNTIASVAITLQLSYRDWNAINSIPLLAKMQKFSFVRLGAASVTDTSSNHLPGMPVDGALPVLSFIPDTTKPRLIAFDLTLPNNTITLYFSEAINLTTINTGGLCIINEVAISPSISQSLQSISKTNLQLQNLTTVIVTLTSDILNVLQNPNIAIGHSASVTYISASSDTIQDFFGNTLIGIPTTEALRVQYLRKCAVICVACR